MNPASVQDANYQALLDAVADDLRGQPEQILERKEKVSLPPLLIMQGGLDDNLLPAMQEHFAKTYRAAGGECQFEVFEGCEHEWVKAPGPMTDKAHEMVKAFIARNLGALRRAA